MTHSTLMNPFLTPHLGLIDFVAKRSRDEKNRWIFRALAEYVLIALFGIALYLVLASALELRAFRALEVAIAFTLLLGNIRPLFAYCRLAYARYKKKDWDKHSLPYVVGILMTVIVFESVMVPGLLIARNTGEWLFPRLPSLMGGSLALFFCSIAVGGITATILFKTFPDETRI